MRRGHDGGDVEDERESHPENALEQIAAHFAGVDLWQAARPELVWPGAPISKKDRIGLIKVLEGSALRQEEIELARKSIGWAQAALLFVAMTAVSVGFTIAFNSAQRHQARLLHSDFWQLVVPSDVVACAVFVIVARFILNRWTAAGCAGSQSHQISRASR
jgi:hypothetical protein